MLTEKDVPLLYRRGGNGAVRGVRRDGLGILVLDLRTDGHRRGRSLPRQQHQPHRLRGFGALHRDQEQRHRQPGRHRCPRDREQHRGVDRQALRALRGRPRDRARRAILPRAGDHLRLSDRHRRVLDCRPGRQKVWNSVAVRRLRQVLRRRGPGVRRQSVPGHPEGRNRQLQGLRRQVPRPTS